MRTRPTISWSDLAGRRVGVWGIGVEGRANLDKLRRLGAEPVLVDDRPPAEPVDGHPVVATDDGGVDALRTCAVVVKTPGKSRYDPAVEALEAAGVPVVGGLGLWLQDVDRDRVVCVTGTKGKSTTVTILGHLLRGLGHDAFVGGNLGRLPYEADVEAAGHELFVLEVSSYQATDLAVSTPVTAVTSLHADHLPWHRDDPETYYRDKLSMCSRPGARVTVANGDSALLVERADLLAPAVRWVSSTDAPDQSWMDTLGLLGAHNRRNALIARACIEELGVTADAAALARAATGFTPLEARLDVVGELGGVTLVDDSLSTNVLSTLAAVDAFPGRRVAVVVGGADRGIDYQPLADGLAARAEPTLVVVTDSEAAGRIDAALAGSRGYETARADDLDRAVELAAGWAAPDGVVVHSPAAPSFDRYRDYRERAAAFRAACARLAGETAD